MCRPISRDIGYVVLSLIVCASSMSGRIDDPMLRALIGRRLRDFVGNVEAEGPAETLH